MSISLSAITTLLSTIFGFVGKFLDKFIYFLLGRWTRKAREAKEDAKQLKADAKIDAIGDAADSDELRDRLRKK